MYVVDCLLFWALPFKWKPIAQILHSTIYFLELNKKKKLNFWKFSLGICDQ